MDRLATVRSGPDRGQFWRPFKKTGLYGPAPPDCSSVPKILDRTERSGLFIIWRPIKRPDRTVQHSGTAVRSRPRKSWTGPYGPVQDWTVVMHICISLNFRTLQRIIIMTLYFTSNISFIVLNYT